MWRKEEKETDDPMRIGHLTNLRPVQALKPHAVNVHCKRMQKYKTYLVPKTLHNSQLYYYNYRGYAQFNFLIY